MLKILYLNLFLIFCHFEGLSYSKCSENCITVEAKAITVSPRAGQNNGSITIAAKGGKGTLYYFFFNEKGYPLNSTKEKLNSIDGLKKGIYLCSVVDEAGCITRLEIELK